MHGCVVDAHGRAWHTEAGTPSTLVNISQYVPR